MTDHSDDNGLTPLDPDEADGLLIPAISNRAELNIVEQLNILEAEQWLENHRQPDIISVDFMKLLHQKMFGKIWVWTGKFRTSGKNIGIDPRLIPEQMHLFCEGVKYQIEYKTYKPDEIAYRFHHRLVWIHPFPNGNGRFARLMTDALLEQTLRKERFSWGAMDLHSEGPIRKQYLAALQAADKGDFSLLSNFVR